MPTLLTESRTKSVAAVKAALIPLARELATETPYSDGVTVAELRILAENRGVIPRRTTGRELSFLGGVMKAAGLVPTDSTRRSPLKESHGNLHRVWRTA